jgi:SPP1 gp7 family putative phage head morphogenesis protein
MTAERDIIDAIDRALDTIAAIKAVPRWQREAEARVGRKMATLTNRALNAALSELMRRGVTVGGVEVQQVLAEWEGVREEVVGVIQDAAIDAAEHGQNAAIDALRKQGVTVARKPLIKQIEEQIRERAFVASARTLDRVTGNIQDALAQGYADGLGTDDIAALLREQFEDMADYELHRVARTEIHGAQSDAAHETIRENAQYKQWISASDDRTRDTHADLSGEIARMDVAYSNGLMYPGDTSGPEEEFINCRCREVPFVMPRGFRAPVGVDRFQESDLVKITD